MIKLILIFTLTMFSISSLASERQIFTFKCTGGFIKLGMKHKEIVKKCRKPKHIYRLSLTNEPLLEDYVYKVKRSRSAPRYMLRMSRKQLIRIVEIRD